MAKREAASKDAPKPAVRNKLFPVGASIYPLVSEVEGQGAWYDRDLGDDMGALQRCHGALVRVFVSWHRLEPQVGFYDESVLDRLAEIVSAAEAHKMKTIVCFFADDGHSELSDVAWGRPRDPRTDAYLLEREAALVAEVVKKLRGEKAVFGWQLGNEAFLSGFTSGEDLVKWTTALRDSILEQDPTRPIALGADAETLLRSTGADAREAIALCDFAVTHVTSAYQAFAAGGPITSGPSTYLEGFLLHLARGDVPVLLDEVGPLTLEYSIAEEAAALRISLWSALCNRASGALLRRLHDMETERREPYFIDPFETLIGVIEAGGALKPAYDEACRFVDRAARIDLEKFPLIAENAAVLMPAERFDPLPSLAGFYTSRACLHAFISAKRAHVPVTVVHEGGAIDESCLLVVPSALSLRDETWQQLTEFVQGGGTLVTSYGGGDAHPAVRDLFGVEFLGDGGARSVLSCRVATDTLGALDDFDARLEVPSHALLSAKTATVVATDAEGNPLVTANQLGQGRAIYISAPIERAIAQNDPWVTPEAVTRFLARVYGSAARIAGCAAPVDCDAAEVELALMQGDDADVIVLLSHAEKPLRTSVTTERRVTSVADVRGGEAVAVGGSTFDVDLEPNGVVALRLSYV